jgi:hypothetical protein
MDSCQKAKKVGYDVGFGRFLRLHSIWSEKSRFHGTPDSVQDRVSAARST